MTELLFRGGDWSYDTIQRIYDAVEEIAIGEMGLAPYPNRIEVITSEQMLDAYASSGMPIYYGHWSFGKHYATQEEGYRKGWSGLAYEIVINSDPCISYVMEENSATMQTIVIAHAAFGHNHFFRNNQMFRQWTDASGILDYLEYSRGYIARCEERHGAEAVERILDAAHALMDQGVHRSPRPRHDLKSEQEKWRERMRHAEASHNELWRSVPKSAKKKQGPPPESVIAGLQLPEENLLYFIEKYAPRLAPWQREIVRIVRLMAQYFYPQRQTKVMNEGTATFTHYKIMSRLHEKGMIDDGAYLEFLTSHTNVVTQRTFEERGFSGFNPYALGFAMMCDIERACLTPTEEDHEWFADIAGCGDPMEALRQIWADYRDESFVAQYLSPRLIREFRMFNLADDPAEPYLRVDAIHDERGYRRVRRSLSREYDLGRIDPNIEVAGVDFEGDRKLVVHHNVIAGRQLSSGACARVLQHIADLWGYDVVLKEIDTSGEVMKEFKGSPSKRSGH
jgi:stage V sporulation protein R